MGQLIGRSIYEQKADMSEIHKAIKDFFKKNPSPSDKEVHELAEKMGIDSHEFESHIYMILGELLKEK